MTRNSLTKAILIVGLLVGFAWFTQPKPNATQPIKMEYSELVQTLEASPATIKSITVVNGSHQLKVETDKGVVNVVVPGTAGEVMVLEKANAAKVKVIAKDAGSEMTAGDVILSLIGSILPTLLIFGLIFFFMARMAKRNGPGGISEEMANRQLREIKPAADRKTFKDVAGCDEAKVEAQEIIDYLKNPGYFAQFGARPPRGVLLVGPPGTGKTLLAKAIAGEANASFFSVTASEFVEMFVGVGAARVRALFNDARKNKPSIIFIDEIDAVGRQRGAGVGGGHDEREQTLNQLLTEMDGFNSNDAVVLMAATNRADVLDPALVRPGRFDRQILVDAPDVEGREAIFKIHTRNKPVAEGVSLRLLAERTPGFTGAEIEGACNEAATVAFRRFDTVAQKIRAAGGNNAMAEIQKLPRTISMEDFDEGIDRVTMGVAKTSRAKTMSVDDKKNTSIHELGHALISELIEGGDPVTKITIVPRARALGYTQSLPSGDRYNYTINNLIARIMMAMGGRAAQEVLLGTIDTGASNDFQQAYNIARRMVTEWGMSSLGPISVSGRDTNPFLGRSMAMAPESGPELTDLIDREVRCILDTCLARTKLLIKEHEGFMNAANDVLMTKETLLAPEWQALMAQHNIARHATKLDLECGRIRKSGEDCTSCGPKE